VIDLYIHVTLRWIAGSVGSLINYKMQSGVPNTVGNKLASDKNTLLAVLQLLRKYNLKVKYVL
jgi:hypothetical protein